MALMPGSIISVTDIRKTELQKQQAATEMIAETQLGQKESRNKTDNKAKIFFFFQFYTYIIQADQ